MQKPNTKDLILILKEHREGLTLSDIELQLNWFVRSDIDNLFKKAKNLGYVIRKKGELYSLDAESGKAKADKKKKVDALLEAVRNKNLPSKVEIR